MPRSRKPRRRAGRASAQAGTPAVRDRIEESPPLRLEWRSPAELAENPANWRRHPEEQISALTGAISEVGWAGACLFNERTGRLIDGHARRKVALEQGTEKVPVLVGDWSEEQEAKILATLDPLAAMAEADKGKLDALLRDVQTGNEAVGKMLTELAEKAAIIPSLKPTESANDINEVYQGMPEFEHEELPKGYYLRVFFYKQEDLITFGKLIGQEVEGRKEIYYPAKFLGRELDTGYIAEEADEP